MRIHTLWHPGDEGDMPWLLDAVDEYTIDEHNGFPPPYLKKLEEYPEARELVLEVSDDHVEKLFRANILKAKVVEQDKFKVAKETLTAVLDNLNNEERFGLETVRQGMAEIVGDALRKLEET